jgi:ketopantoate hydroxymethyltransferase
MKSKEYIDAKFVKRYSNQYEEVVNSLKNYKKDVESKIFPSEQHSYNAEKLTPENIKEWKKEIKKILS